jgi:hypothetical protein
VCAWPCSTRRPRAGHPDLPAVRLVPLTGGPHAVGVHGTLITGVIAAVPATASESPASRPAPR